MWEIQLIWGFWWKYKYCGALHKFDGGRRMTVTLNCVNETKIFQLELGEKTRTYPILIDLFIPVQCQMKTVESVKDKITCFFGYCNPNCIQYSWGTWLILSKLSTMFGFKHLHCLLAPMHRQCIKVDSFNPYE